mmetsp:Transcript_32935/g.81557  ORF Transcript_32935/g.81557 Transcript_32935/m.81557 type:complete len:86 (-) Transcript_32935:16-273(-)
MVKAHLDVQHHHDYYGQTQAHYRPQRRATGGFGFVSACFYRGLGGLSQGGPHLILKAIPTIIHRQTCASTVTGGCLGGCMCLCVV